MITINNLIANSITITTGPVVPAETHIKFVDGTEGDYSIEGTMDCPALVTAGLMLEGSGTTTIPTWSKQPLEVNIGSAVTGIYGNPSVFYECSSIYSVTIPGSVTSIGGGVFNSCSGIQVVTMLDGVTSIEANAFSYCNNLTSVTIPDSVTSIYGYAFSGCDKLESVTFSGKDMETVQGMANYRSWNLPSGCTIHCTDGNITY